MNSHIPPWQMSLVARVALAVALLLGVGGVLVSIAAFAYGRQAAQDAYDRLLVGAATDIAASISVDGGDLLVDLPISAFQLLALAPDDRIAYRVTGPGGEVLTGYADLPDPPETPATGLDFYDAAFFGEAARYAAVTRRFAERNVSGPVEVIVGQTLRARRALALEITQRALVVMAGAGVLMSLLAVFVVRSALRPLDRLAEAVARRDPYDLTPIKAPVPKEAIGMVSALNGFMGRIDQQVRAMRGLISDTAHQLRTPVAALRAQADLAAGEPDGTRRDAIVMRIHRRTVDLGHLLDQMLSRALVIHRAESVRREAVDLRDAALEVVEAGDFALTTPGVEIRLVIGEAEVPVQGDLLSLTEAAKNLLGNAVKYGASPVRVGASVEEGRAVLWVEDGGSGPAPAILDRLGSRFAHNSAVRGDGAGLGLAIAAAVAQAYGGELVLERVDAGFRAALVLPLAEGSV
ncbi:sensor histidine kinase [Puniceibacterium sediminis]|uniref:histidine kinase n=1 Tax=Puniceibacterium sediminis TaxID=1608407 RepID=A0A238UTI2_9RHOB|nr:sensor histidine kinase [Puniceibacterium sediminis]SNR24609.1 two-component system, OmpR family, sensor histidine kinase TctE [Puniceibacterium sediminis]